MIGKWPVIDRVACALNDTGDEGGKSDGFVLAHHT
jgi:hypothetical protein